MTISKISSEKEDFFQKVFEVVKLIPQGKVTSYGAIAAFLGAKSGARMVGWAMNASHKNQINIPAHRVVNRKGILSGKMHFETPETMKNRLEEEGIQIINDEIINFEQHFWNPLIELDLEK